MTKDNFLGEGGIIDDFQGTDDGLVCIETIFFAKNGKTYKSHHWWYDSSFQTLRVQVDETKELLIPFESIDYLMINV